MENVEKQGVLEGMLFTTNLRILFKDNKLFRKNKMDLYIQTWTRKIAGKINKSKNA